MARVRSAGGLGAPSGSLGGQAEWQREPATVRMGRALGVGTGSDLYCQPGLDTPFIPTASALTSGIGTFLRQYCANKVNCAAPRT